MRPRIIACEHFSAWPHTRPPASGNAGWTRTRKQSSLGVHACRMDRSDVPLHTLRFIYGSLLYNRAYSMLPTRSSLLLRHSRQSFHLDSETGQRTEDTGQNTGAGGGGTQHRCCNRASQRQDRSARLTSTFRTRALTTSGNPSSSMILVAVSSNSRSLIANSSRTLLVVAHALEEWLSYICA